MYNTDVLAEKLVDYVKSGILTQETAMAVYDAAEARNVNESEDTLEDLDLDMTLEAALDELKDKFDDVKDSAEKKAEEIRDASAKKMKEVKGDIEEAKGKLKDKIDDITSDENKARAKAAVKKAAPIVAASTVATAFVGTGAFKLLSASEQKSAKDIAGLKDTMHSLTLQYVKGQIPKTEYDSRYDKLNGILHSAENASVFSKIKSYMKAKSTPAKYKHESAIDMINEFLEERIMEAESVAPAEANPLTHEKDEIDEKLPTVTPNEPGCIGCVADIEKTDKAIEDAKKDLDVAGKLAEMKAKHEAEKDTTQSHEVIKQIAEESVKEAKLNIYEAYDCGCITAEEKTELLSLLEEATL